MKYKALFWQNYEAKSKEFDKIEEAFDFLVHGEAFGELKAVGVFDGEKLHELIFDHEPEPYLDDRKPKHKKQDLKLEIVSIHRRNV